MCAVKIVKFYFYVKIVGPKRETDPDGTHNPKGTTPGSGKIQFIWP